MTTEALNRDVALQGFCSPRFERLRDAFKRNFFEHGEVGGSYAVYVKGELVADLWGGSLDFEGKVPWERDTIACVWSAAKGIGATCFAYIVDRGLCRYDDKVAKYWPEFAAEGKGEVTIGMLLSHQTGITGFAEEATLSDILAGEAAAARFAAQKPLWKPGEASGYSNAVGVMATALFKRIEGRSIQQFVLEEMRGVWGLDLAVGLPESDRGRVADLLGGETLSGTGTIPNANAAQKQLHNPPMKGDMANLREFQAADVVAMNGYTNGRALAGMYNLLMYPGANGKRLVSAATLQEASRRWFDGVDMVRGVRRPWAAGYLRNEEGVWGPNADAFGHGGWGGAFGFADPVSGVAVGYAMNLMSDQMDLNPRRRGLIQAVFEAL